MTKAKYPTESDRITVRLMIRADILAEAKKLKLNISQAAEVGIAAAIKAAQGAALRSG